MRGRACDGGVGSRRMMPRSALDEALCYGWIDSLIKRIDDDRYARVEVFREPRSSYRRMYLTWIDSAKRDVTKQTRLQQAVKMLSAGRKPGLG